VRARPAGQSLVEFALTLPIMLLIVLGAIDLGRVYFMTVNLENAVKEGAFFGARNPGCDTDARDGCTDPQTVLARVEQELDTFAADSVVIRCFVPGTTNFAGSGKALTSCVDGDLYFVAATATFDLITPLVSNIVGASLTLSSSATSVVITRFASPGGAIDPGPPGGATPTPLPPGICTVPNFTLGTRIGDAQDVWQNVAGFGTTVTRVGPNGQQISWQSLPPGFTGPCTSTTITVSNEAQATPTPGPTPAPTPTPDPGTTPGPTASPEPTPTMCTVPQMVLNGNNALTVTQAQGAWVGAGFRQENFSATRPPNHDYRVGGQTIAAGQLRPCLTTAIEVNN
jgi:Flp pilus assembly protein TadG